MPAVVTFGEAMALFRAAPGEPLRTAGQFARSIAGAESNLAVGLCRLGCEAGWFGRVGNDPLGLGILDILRREKVDVAHAVVDSSAPTGILVRDTHAERRIDVVYARKGTAASRLSPSDLDAAYLASARVLHVTGITPALSPTARSATAEAVKLAREAGVTISFDPNIRRRLWSSVQQARRALVPLAERSQLVLASHHEATLLSGERSPRAAAKWFIDLGAEIVAIKLGSGGAWATDGDKEYHGDALPVHPMDPIGAGDAFDAGFLCAWVAGADIRDCVEEGNLAGGLSVQACGDIEGLPYRHELDERRAENLETNR